MKSLSTELKYIDSNIKKDATNGKTEISTLRWSETSIKKTRINFNLIRNIKDNGRNFVLKVTKYCSKGFKGLEKDLTTLHNMVEVLNQEQGRVQYSRVQYSTVQYSTVQYSTVQYSTVQYSTVQYTIYGGGTH